MIELTTGMLSIITSSLLTVFSVQVAFLGFLCALYFTRPWGRKERVAFKFLISLIFISVVIMGVACGYVIYNSNLQEIKIMLGISLPIVLYIVIGCLIMGALFVTIAVVI
jgi:hypothetical protein